MSRSISFSVSENEYAMILHEASARGLTPSSFTKMKLFDHINKAASKGAMAQLHQIEEKYRKLIENPV
jgi:hypothetical protein